MFVLKLGLVTCVFYACITILIELVLLLLARLMGSAGYSLRRRSWALAFGSVAGLVHRSMARRPFQYRRPTQLRR